MHRNRYLHTILLLLLCLIPATRPATAVGGNTWSYYLLTDDNKLGMGVESQPSLPITPIAVVGLNAGDSLVAIDVRPQNGHLYGLATTSAAGAVQLYSIDLSSTTPYATAIGAPGSFVDAGNTPITDLGTNFGVDFNPALDRLRVVSDNGSNFRINPNTGALLDGNLGGAPTAGTNPDGPINGATTSVDATAYTNNTPNTSATTQYTLDSNSDSLFIQNLPNSGTQTTPLAITLNGTPLDFSSSGGFDIPPGVNAPTSNSATTGQALAALTVSGVAGLYSIELSTGVASLVGTLAGLTVRDIAVFSTTPAAIVLDSNSSALVRFSLSTPGTTTTQAISGITAGEILVGIDGRPATGQLYGLGVNADANTASLYVIDPQTGAATLIGTASQVAFVDAASNVVDLPAMGSGYGIDFNPTVDRIRVVTGSGLNFRINPITGAPVDGNLGLGSPPAGINPDGAANGLPGGSTGVSATAYTNNYGQPLSGGVTTQYTLDANSNRLFIQNPPNAGTQVNGLAITIGGAPVDFSEVNGFDIPPGVNVASSGSPANGSGYAALSINGALELYRINLATGAATNLGVIGTPILNGALPAPNVGGLVIWNAPSELSIAGPAGGVTEADGNITLTITRESGAPIVVGYTIIAGTASADSDYTPTSGVLAFNSGQLSKTITLHILDDTIAEPDENLTVQLSGPIAGTTSLLLTIIDDDRSVFLPLIGR